MKHICGVVLLQGPVGIRFGDARSIIHDSLVGIWHCLRVPGLFVLWKLCCRYDFENKVSSVSTMSYRERRFVCSC